MSQSGQRRAVLSLEIERQLSAGQLVQLLEHEYDSKVA